MVEPIAPERRLELLDVLRFIAAAVVLCNHYLYSGVSSGKIETLNHLSPVASIARYGQFGVDLFFVISGYVIFRSAHRKTASEFTVGRGVRLYPAFWCAVVITTVVSHFIPNDIIRPVGGRQFVANLTMLPGMLGEAFVDPVYWTLRLELYFYAVVLMLLTLRQRDRMPVLFPCWALVVLAVQFVAPDTGTPLLSGYYAYFAGGASIALIARSGWTPLNTVGLAAAYAASIMATLHRIDALGDNYSTLALVLIVTAIYLAVLAVNMPLGRRVHVPGSRMLGDLTYPLYLVHAHVGYMLLSELATEGNKWVVYPLVVAVLLGIAYAINRLAERAPRAFWFRLFGATAGRTVAVVSREPTPALR